MRLIVPFHNKDLKRTTLESLIERADLTNDEFGDLLYSFTNFQAFSLRLEKGKLFCFA
jgi:hypothetical protein